MIEKDERGRRADVMNRCPWDDGKNLGRREKSGQTPSTIENHEHTVVGTVQGGGLESQKNHLRMEGVGLEKQRTH